MLVETVAKSISTGIHFTKIRRKLHQITTGRNRKFTQFIVLDSSEKKAKAHRHAYLEENHIADKYPLTQRRWCSCDSDIEIQSMYSDSVGKNFGDNFLGNHSHCLTCGLAYHIKHIPIALVFINKALPYRRKSCIHT